MPNYIICTRNVAGNKFGDEPGPTSYLVVPEDAPKSSPGNAVTQKKFLTTFLSKKKLQDVLIFVHGYNNKIEEVIESHNKIKNGLRQAGYQGELISFDWPSSSKTLMYLEDRHDAKTTAMELVSSGIALLAKQQGTGCTLNVHVLAHSTGAYIIREAFDDAETTQSTAEINWTVSQLMFISGDISSDAMSGSNAETVYRHCNRFTNYFNPHDGVLAISNVKRVGFKNRVGRVGLPSDVPSKAVDIDCGSYFQANQDDIPIKGVSKSHSWYFHSDDWMKDATETIKGSLDRNVLPTREKNPDGKLSLKGTA